MALVFPRTPASYRAFFKEFADRHIYINNNDRRQNFYEVTLGSAMRGFTDIDVNDFFSKLRTSAKVAITQNETNCGMILIEMDGDSDEGQARMNMRMVNASFAIVTIPQNKADQEAKTAAKDICYETGLDIVFAIKDFFIQNYMLGKIMQINDECIGKISDNMVGWRFDITYLVMRDSKVRPNMFEGLVVEELLENNREL